MKSIRSTISPARCIRGVLPVVLIPVLILAAGFGAWGQQQPFVELALFTMTLIPDEQLTLMAQLVADLDAAEPEAPIRLAFLDQPRFTMDEYGIYLEPSVLEIDWLRFDVEPEADEPPWLRIAEPLDGLVPDRTALVWMGDRVLVFLQLAYDPDDPARVRPGDESPDVIESLLSALSAFSGDTLERIREASKALDAGTDQDMQEALENPREFFLGWDIPLPASFVRIGIVDISRARERGAFGTDPVREGLALLDVGLGFIGEGMALFTRVAI